VTAGCGRMSMWKCTSMVWADWYWSARKCHFLYSHTNESMVIVF